MPSRGRSSSGGYNLVTIILYGLIVIFFFKFVFHIIPDPVDESTLFSAMIGVIALLASVIMTWLRQDVNELKKSFNVMRDDISAMKSDIAVIKSRLDHFKS